MVGAAPHVHIASGLGRRARARGDARGVRRSRRCDHERVAWFAQCGASTSAEAPTRPGSRLMAAPRMQMAEDLIRSFAATMRSVQLYSKGHPIIGKNIESLAAAIQMIHSVEAS